MATLSGELSQFYQAEQFVHPVGSQVIVTHEGKVVAVGEIDRNDTFTIELPEGLLGEIEIVVGTVGAAPTIVEVDGSDLNVSLIYSPGGAYY